MKKTILLFVFLLGLAHLGLNAQNWGASPDNDATSILGDWSISTDSLFQSTLVMTTPDPNRIFYRTGKKLANYTVKANVKLLEMKNEAGFYPKYGFFPAYKNPENWIWVYMHPLPAEDFISVVAMVEGAYTIVWQIFSPANMNINYQNYNELKISKVDNLFTVFVNGNEKANFTAAIDSAWAGICTDAVRTSYKNFSVVNDNATGIADLSNSMNLRVFPNPVSKFVQIDSDVNIKSIEIYDLLGHKVDGRYLNKNRASYNVESLDNGIYFFKITNETGLVNTKRIMVNK
jgi:hypothetical protein